MQTTHTRPFLSSALRILVILSILTGAAFVVYDRTRVGAIIGHSLKKLGLSTGAAGATLTVNSTADTDDAGDSLLTLREAIRISNGIRGVGPGETGQVVGPPGGGLDNIVFDVGTGTPTITVTSVLPTISNPVFINGNTGGATRVELSGAALSPTAPSGNNGLTIDGGSCRIRSLVLNRFTNLGLGATAILLLDGGISAGSTVIEDCYIGTNAAGTAALANNLGIEILGSPTNLIGGTAAGTRNVISGNTRDGVSISSGADGNRIEGNYIGTNASGSAAIANGRGITIEGSGVTGNIIGGTAAGARNIISGNGTASDNGTGILLRDGTSANRVEGNYIGTNVSGTLDLGNTAAGVQIGDSATSNVIGGTTAGARNVISGNDREGILIFGTSNRVEGNYIGANAAGTATLGNARSGILLDTAKTNVIGGTTAAARNIISGNSFWGVEFADGSGGVLGTTGNLVQGNYIGSDVTGAIDLGNLLGGVNVVGSTNSIGGTAAGAGNQIAFNRGYGVRVAGRIGDPMPFGNSILGNSIFSNAVGGAAGLGIDLVTCDPCTPGVTANDTGDGDAGPNGFQNFPVLDCAVSANSQTTIKGTLNSTAGTVFNVQFFSNEACDASGNGEGQTYLGQASVTTDGSGNVAISATLPVAVPAGRSVTATATGPTGSTSEFSACVTSTAPTLAINDVTVTEGSTGTTNAVFTVTLSGALGVCLPVTVNYATAPGTAVTPGDYATTSGTLTFTPPFGAATVTQTITVPIVVDTIAEPDETFVVNLSLATSPTLTNATITDAQGIGTITNDDLCTPMTLNPATLPDGYVGVSYSQMLTVTGGAAPHTFAVTAGALPTGLTLAPGGALSGSPTAAGTFSFTVTATDANNCPVTRSYSIVVNTCPAITVSPASLPSGLAGTGYSQTISATGGVTPHTFSISAGTLPAGLTLTAGGALSGTPTTAGVFTFTVRATDANGCTGTQAYTLVICATITVTPATLPGGFTAIPYSQTLSATGGTSPYTFAVTAGALPGGLTLTGAGILSGTPTAVGTFTFTVTATDTNGCTGSQSYTVIVSDCPAITVNPATLPSGLAGASYSQTITATGGATPHTFSVSAGTLPAGLTLTAGGALSGTPTTAGVFTFTVMATDANGCTGTRAYTLVICPTITVSPATLPNGFTTIPYSQTLTATGGATPHTFAVTTGALPGGLTLTGAGALSGTPTAAGTFTFTVTATDTNGCTGSQSYTVVISDCPAITVNPASLPSGLVGASYSQAVTATGGAAPYSFGVIAGALPAGLTLATDGTLSGTPTAAGVFTFTVLATDINGCTGTRAYSLVICATITLNPATLPNGFAGVTYSQMLTATSGTSPYTFAVTAGALPGGLSLTAAGVLSGMPAATGTFTFTVTATDANLCTGSQSYSLIIGDCPAITVTPATLPGGSVGATYSQTITATGGVGPYSFSVSAGTLPAGLTLAAGGTLAGTPTTAGVGAFTVMATDANGCTGAQAYTVVICAAITVNPASLPSGLVGAGYTQTITATGGVAPYSFSLSAGTLPAGLTLAADGTLAGTPTTAGVGAFTVMATDTNGCMGTRAYTLVICATITVTPATLPNGFTSIAYSQTLSATGGTSPYGFAVTAGALPGGLTLNGAGLLSGAPAAAGTFTFTVTATDANGCTGSQSYTVIISDCPAITVNPASLPSGLAGTSYSQTITATGGVAPHTFSVSAGTLPAGLTLTTGGALSGTPTTAGVFTFTVRATDANGCTGTRAYTLVICPTITVNPASLPNGFTTIPYSQTLSATGGTSPYTFAVTTGALPGGLTLTGAGILSGTPTAAGTFSFTVTATDANGCTGSQSYTVVISDCPTITVNPASLPSGLVGTGYSQTVTATGGVAPYTFSVIAGTLPAGLSLATDGALTGTPTTAGLFNFTVKATDANGCAGTRAYTLRICPVVTLSPATLPSGFAGVLYNQTLTATGGTSPYTFAVTAGALPSGLSLSPAGVLSGAPTVSGTFTFTVTATDANGCAGLLGYSLVIGDCPAISIDPASLFSGLTGIPYSRTLTASGGVSPYTFAMTFGALPAGVTLSTGGVLSGTPTAAGTFTFTVTAADANGCAVSQGYTLIINNCPVITINPATLPGGTVGASYSQTITATGGTALYNFNVIAGTLPPGLSLAADGSLTGTPTTVGTFTFTVKTTDANGCTGTRIYTMQVCPPITVSPASLPNGFAAISYSQMLSATGGTSPYSFAVTAGALPGGLSLSTAGLLSGIPVGAGTFNFTVTATDASTCAGSRSYTVVINDCPAISLSPASLTAGAVGLSYSQTVTATGGVAPHTFSISAGALPAGLTLSAAGILSGTPTASGVFNFTVKATDVNGCMGTLAYTLVICSPVTVNPASLPSGFAGVTYNQTLSASGGVSPYTFAVTGGALPGGLTLSSAGILSGAPTTSGTFTFTVTATDNLGCPGARSYTVVINDCPAITVGPASLPNGAAGAGYSQTVTAAGGTAPYIFSVSAGTLPPGLSFSAAGALTGTATTAGVFTFTVKATDANGCAGTRVYALAVCGTITLNPATLPSGFVDAPYSQTLTATGGTAPYTFALTPGPLPPGVTLAADGTLAGTPVISGIFNFTVTATDASGCTGTRSYSIVVNNCPTITVNPASLPGGVAGASYSQTITASGGASPYSFSVSAGTLPPGLTLASGGALTGTPTTAGVFNFTVKAMDLNSCMGTRAYTVTICPTITVNPASLPNGLTTVAYSQTITATGGTGPYTFAVTTGALPGGLTLGASGALTGTPTAAGTFNFTVTATDANGCAGTRSYSVVITACPTITVNPATLPNGLVSDSYNQTLTATGGTAPHTYAVTAGSLPTGLTLSTSGALTGTPTAAGTFNFAVTATDANGCTGSRSYSIVITNCTPITVNPASMPGGSVGVGYSQTVSNTGGVAPITFSVSAGTLPTGLTLASSGALTGTPTAGGVFNFTVKATDANGCMGTRAYTVLICATITVNPATLPSGFAGAAYNQTLTATGGTAPYTFALTPGPLPPGVSLATDGTLSGSPLITGTFNFTITATDANGCTGSRSYTIIVNTCPTVTVSPASMPGGLVGASYSQTITASGAAPPYTYSVSAGTLPPGLTLASGGALTGTPTTGGTFNFTVKATDTNGCAGTRAYTVQICPTITLTPASLPNGFTAVAYSQTLSATGGVAPYTYAVTAGTLPGGLTLTAAGALSGTPTAPGTFSFTVTATDANGCTGSTPYSVVISDCPAITVNPATLPDGFTAIAYSQTLTAAGGVAPHTFAVTTGALPGGLTLSASGALTGTPAGSGTFSFTVRVTDANGCTGSRSYTIAISGCPAVAVNPTSLPNGLTGSSYSQTIAATGGAAPYTFTVSAGTLPAGLTLAAGGLLSGTPTTMGAFSFTVKATDANGCMGTRAYTVQVCPAITVNPASLPSGFTTAPYSQTLTASGGASPYTFAVSSGALPPGITLTSAGALSGAPTSAGEFNFTVTATDANTCAGSRSYTIFVNNCPPITVSPASLPGGLVGASYSQTISATGSVPPYTFTVSAGTLPAGLTLSSGGALTGTLTTAGVFNFTVKAADANGCSGTQAYTVVICPTITVNPAVLPNGSVGVAYSQTLTAVGGTALYTYAVTAGAAPGGLSLTTAGVLSGSPAGIGTFTFTVTATDANGCPGTRSYTIVINNCPAITVNPASLPGGLVGTSYTQTITATGGAEPYTFSVSAGTLPAGLTLATGGSLTGTPTTAGTFTFTVTATDANGCTGTRAYTVLICPTITVNPASLPDGFASITYSQTLTASGGTAPYSFAVTAGALPGGLSLSAGGVLSGAPTAFGTFAFTVTATDANGCAGARSYSLLISNCAAITVNPASLPNGLIGAGYSQTFTATGGATPYTFAVSAGTLPAGLTLASSGALTGAPTAAGTFTFTVKTTDVNGCMGTRAYTLIICPTITVNPASLPNGSTGIAYSQTLTATGGTAPHIFAVTTGTLPGGLSLSAGGGLIGTPTAAGTFTFTVAATDANGCTGERSYTLVVTASGLMYYPLPRPIRLLETRPGEVGCDAPGAAIPGGTSRTQTAAGRTCSGITIPTNAKALTGNITTVQSGGGYLTLYPSDAAQPTVANSNYEPNEVLNNVFTVGLGATDGAFNIFVTSTTHIVVDVTGYYAPPGAGGLYFHPLPKPIRLLETRPGELGCTTPGTPLLGGADTPQQARLTCDGVTIPAAARAIVGNATTVNPGGGYLTLYPADATRPLVASSNYLPGQIMNGPFTVGLSPAGLFNIFVTTNTDLVIDVLGYYSEDATDVNGVGLFFNPLAHPVRLLETRDNPAFPGCYKPNAPIVGGVVRTQPARGVCDGLTIASNALGIVGNATVVNNNGGYLTFWPSDATQPLVATSNFLPGQIFNRHFTVGLSAGPGAFKIFSAQTTDLVIDVTGYFAP